MARTTAVSAPRKNFWRRNSHADFLLQPAVRVIPEDGVRADTGTVVGVESGKLLSKRLDAAEAQYQADQKEAGESKTRFAQRLKSAQAEFARLEKLLG